MVIVLAILTLAVLHAASKAKAASAIATATQASTVPPTPVPPGVGATATPSPASAGGSASANNAFTNIANTIGGFPSSAETGEGTSTPGLPQSSIPEGVRINPNAGNFGKPGQHYTGGGPMGWNKL